MTPIAMPRRKASSASSGRLTTCKQLRGHTPGRTRLCAGQAGRDFSHLTAAAAPMLVHSPANVDRPSAHCSSGVRNPISCVKGSAGQIGSLLVDIIAADGRQGEAMRTPRESRGPGQRLCGAPPQRCELSRDAAGVALEVEQCKPDMQTCKTGAGSTALPGHSCGRGEWERAVHLAVPQRRCGSCRLIRPAPPRSASSSSRVACATGRASHRPAIMALTQRESDIQALLAAQCHLGTKNVTASMERYTYRRRNGECRGDHAGAGAHAHGGAWPARSAPWRLTTPHRCEHWA